MDDINSPADPVCLQAVQDQKLLQRLGNFGSWVYDIDLDRICLSDQACVILKLPQTSVLGLEAFLAQVFAPDRAAVREALLAALQGQGFDRQHRVVDAQTWVRQTAEFSFDGAGQPVRAVGLIQNMSERVQIERAMQKKEQYQRALLDNFPFGVWLKDPQSKFLAVNAELAGWFGITDTDELMGKDDFYTSPPDLAAAYQADDRAVLVSRLKKHVEEEIVIGGVRKWFETYKAPVIDKSGEVLGTVGFSRDITDRKLAEEEINSLAFFDTLTRLPNRRLLVDRLRQAVALSERTHKHGALLFIDLDDFKTLNDTRGHDMGDLLLQQVAQRLVTCVRPGDTVARLGGDEFVVILEDLSEPPSEAAKETEVVARRMLAVFNLGFELFTETYHSTCSMGAALFSKYAGTVEDLLKRADLAMYQSKAVGGNAFHFFDPEMQAAVSSRAALEAGLREAVHRGQFLLHYQAQVSAGGRLKGVEALVRWQHPQRGLVSPVEFIALAESSSLILPLGQWVLETACKQLVRWSHRPELAHLTMAVNVSARQFSQPDFVDQVLSTVKNTGANPRQLKLELTEGVLVSNVDDTIAKMHALKAAGVGLSLDDFGTGYSSLLYLKRMPLDQLKIDKSFVRDVLRDANDRAIAKAIVVLAHTLGMAVIAEGVETPEQYAFLMAIGCTDFQGYLFSKPLPLLEFEAFAAR